MSSNLAVINGNVSLAIRGAPAWHNQGNPILPTDTLEIIAEKAGLTYTVNSSPARFEDQHGQLRTVPFQRVLYRNDTGTALGVCHPSRYKIHQPTQILEFFRDFLSDNKLTIETAGAIAGGRVIWCLAKLGPDLAFLLPGEDLIDGYVRLQTSFDGSRSTSLVATTVRIVCQNTLHMCEQETNGHAYRTPHTVRFDSKPLQYAFGLIGEQHRITNVLWNELVKRKVSAHEATRFFLSVMDVPESMHHDVAHLTTYKKHQFEALNDLFYHGPGAQKASASGTAFGLLQAVTHYMDFKATVRTSPHDDSRTARLASAWFGVGNDKKRQALKLASNLADASELVPVAA